MGATKRRTGRPMKIDQVVATINGRDVTASERIVALIRAGNFIETAGNAVGIEPSTLREWLRTGAGAYTRVHNGARLGDLTTKQRRCMDFSQAVAEAQAEAEARDVAVLDQLAGGGLVVETVTTKTDKDGNTTETTTKRETLAPSAQVLEWRLERRFPDRWGRRRLEISGPDGEAIPVEVRVAGLVAQAREFHGAPAIETTATETDDDNMGEEPGG